MNVRYKRKVVTNLLSHPLDGKTVVVVSHPDPTHTGRSGTVVNETANTITLSQTSGSFAPDEADICIPKQQGLFRFILTRKGDRDKLIAVLIRGEYLLGSVTRRKKRKLRYF